MNLDQIAGIAIQVAGKLSEKWGLAVKSNAYVVAGRHVQLLGRIQESQGDAREASRKQLRQWVHLHDNWRLLGTRSR